MNLTVALQITSLILGILATVGVPNPPRFQMLAAAFSFFIASLLVGQL